MSESAKKRHYVAMIVVSNVYLVIALAINDQLPTGEDGITYFFGMSIGFMILPLLAIRFISNLAGWIVITILGSMLWMGASSSSKSEHTLTRYTMGSNLRISGKAVVLVAKTAAEEEETSIKRSCNGRAII